MPSKLDNPVAPVYVSVDKDEAGKVTITCSPDTVPVTGYNSMITFHLLSPGYSFRRVGAIALDNPAPDFPYSSWTVSSTMATLFDTCNTVGTFPYTVTVVDVITGVEYSVDPEIKNGDQP